MSQDSSRIEEQQVSGNQLLGTLKRILREGNVRRVVVKNASGRSNSLGRGVGGLLGPRVQGRRRGVGPVRHDARGAAHDVVAAGNPCRVIRRIEPA